MKQFIVETSARHVHVTQQDLETLFGKGYELTVKKMLSQPGQYASAERVDVVGPKKTLTGVSILGPVRSATQVELSLTDARSIGVTAPVRESGDIAGSGACKLVGPAGEVELTEGVIAAKRHIHMTPADAEEYGVKYVAGARPWGEKADIALPSATQNEIDGDDARTLVANGVFAVSEGANMPSTPEAIKVFQEAGLLYAPGKAANAGGVAVSGLEMSQNSERLRWSSEEVDAKLHNIMNEIHANCVKYGTQPDGYVNYVRGANVAGFLKVAKAMMAQGIV